MLERVPGDEKQERKPPILPGEREKKQRMRKGERVTSIRRRGCANLHGKKILKYFPDKVPAEKRGASFQREAPTFVKKRDRPSKKKAGVGRVLRMGAHPHRQREKKGGLGGFTKGDSSPSRSVLWERNSQKRKIGGGGRKRRRHRTREGEKKGPANQIAKEDRPPGAMSYRKDGLKKGVGESLLKGDASWTGSQRKGATQWGEACLALKVTRGMVSLKRERKSEPFIGEIGYWPPEKVEYLKGDG